MAISFEGYDVGSVVIFGRYAVANETPWDLEWLVVNRGDNQLILMTHDIIDLRAFDGREPSNPDANRKSYGNNNWRYSNIRQFLNAMASSSWYTAQHTYDAPPNAANISYNTQYDSRPGFLSRFTQEELDLIIPIFNTTAANTVTDGGGAYGTADRVWLPSYTQVGFGNINNVAEGTVFQYFTGADNAKRIATMHPKAFANTSSTSKPANDATAWQYWLRTPYTSYSYIVCCVSTSGSNNHHYAYYGNFGLRPCIVVPATGRYDPSSTGAGSINKIVLPSSTSMDGKSAIRDVATPAVKIIPYVAWNEPAGATLKVYACNNAYDASPTWEDVTAAYENQAEYTLTNTTKTASKWGIQLRVVATRGSAAAVSIPACAFALV